MNKGVLNNAVPMRPTQAVSGGSIGDTMRAMMTPKNILIIVSLLIIVGVAVYYYFYVIYIFFNHDGFNIFTLAMPQSKFSLIFIS